MSQQSRAERRRRAREEAKQRVHKLELPPAPTSVKQGFMLPLKIANILIERPMAWAKPSISSFIMMVSLLTLCSEMIINLVLVDASSQLVMLARQLLIDFLFWLFLPLLLVVFLAGALRYLGNGRLGYGLVSEPLKSPTGALMGIGVVALIGCVIVKTAAGAFNEWGGVASNMFLIIFWYPMILMATTECWAQEKGAVHSMKWGIKRVWGQKRPWAGIGLIYMISALLVGLGTGFLAVIMNTYFSGQGAMMLFSLVLLIIMGLVASLIMGLNGIMALVMHQDGSN